ncbi:MAG: c-type cytochrome [Bdellovibrionota bacterium]
MKKLARTIGIVVIALVVLAAIAFGTVYSITESKRNAKITVDVKSVLVPTDEASLTEGKRLVSMRGCADCHGEDYAGFTIVDEAPIGTYTGANLTGGQGSATAQYQDIDWVRSIRYGISPAGRPLIFMPSTDFTGISDEDLGKMIAYLKTLPKVDREQKPIVIGPLARVLAMTGKMPILFSHEHVNRDLEIAASVKPEANAEYGRYLAQGCTGCHGEHFSGGPVPGVPPSWPLAANLTASGKVNAYTLEQFTKVLREGVTPEGRQLNSQYMPWKAMAHMNDTEIVALYEFVKQLPAREAGTH